MQGPSFATQGLALTHALTDFPIFFPHIYEENFLPVHTVLWKIFPLIWRKYASISEVTSWDTTMIASPMLL